MARYSDNRERNRETKSLYKTWSKVDSQIQLPPSLTGHALLPLLDQIPEPKQAVREPHRKIQFSPRVFSWKSATTYAAALVLIVALSALLSRSPTDTARGVVVIDEPAGSDFGANANPLDPDVPDPGTQPESDADAGANENLPATPRTPEDTPVADNPADGAEPAGGAEQPVDAEGPVGGSGESIILHEDASYVYTWRPNDLTDPDKAGYPLVVNVMNMSTGELAFSVDVAAIESVTQSFLYGSKLSLVGTSATNEADEVLLVYDFSQPGQADNVLEHSLPGKLLAARLYKNIVNVVTYAPAWADPGCEITALPDGTGDDLCVIAAVDLDTVQVEQKAFAGAGETISLYNLNAYLDYEGTITDDNPEGHHVAHIRLDGTNIELRTEE